MSTSGTFAWELDIDEVIEDAYEMAGLEMRTSYNSQTARRSLNLLLTEWVTEGINLWTVELNTTSTIADTAAYTLNAKYYDVIDVALRDSDGNDRPLDRLNYQEYLAIPDKDQSGPPNSVLVQRDNDTITLTVWPVPDDTDDTIIYHSIRYMEDVNAMQQNPEIPRRFLPALIAGLAVKLALKNPAKWTTGPDNRPIQIDGVSNEHYKKLVDHYTDVFMKAREEDRERDSWRIRVNAAL